MSAALTTSARTRADLVHPASLRSPDGLALVEGWRALAAGARFANPFQGPDLVLPALQHLAAGADVRLLTVGEPGTDGPGLVLPLAMRRRYRRLPWRVTTGWQHAHHFLGTPLVTASFGVDGWRAALDHLAVHGPDPWLLLPSIDADVARDVEDAARRDGRETRRMESASRPTTYRHASDDYLEQRLSGSRRKELRRVRRRLAEAVGGDLALLDLVAEARLDEGLEAFLRLEAAGWKGDDGGAIAANPGERAWFLDACRRAAAHDGLEILSLQGSDGRPVAMGVNLRDGDTLFTVKIAYDQRRAAYSPGLLLYMDQLHRFHDSGAAVLDTCAEPGHEMASRLHADRRELVTLAVGLRGRGHWVVRSAPALLRGGDRARDVVGSMRRRRDPAAHTQTPRGTTPTPAPSHPQGDPR